MIYLWTWWKMDISGEGLFKWNPQVTHFQCEPHGFQFGSEMERANMDLRR